MLSAVVILEDIFLPYLEVPFVRSLKISSTFGLCLLKSTFVMGDW